MPPDSRESKRARAGGTFSPILPVGNDWTTREANVLYFNSGSFRFTQDGLIERNLSREYSPFHYKRNGSYKTSSPKMLALSIPGAQRGQMRRHQRRRPTPPSTLPPAAEGGGRATDATVSPVGSNGNFEYINGNGADKSRTESWEKLKASGALDGPALGHRGGD